VGYTNDEVEVQRRKVEHHMETLEEYFQHRNTPGAGSPTGLAMIELLKMDSTITFQEARRLVNEVGASTTGPKRVAQEVMARRSKLAA
jgi:hypothetical protein